MKDYPATAKQVKAKRNSKGELFVRLSNGKMFKITECENGGLRIHHDEGRFKIFHIASNCISLLPLKKKRGK